MKRHWFVAIVLAGIILSACQPGAGDEPGEVTGTPEAVSGQAMVDSLEVLILESFPVQVRVVARGALPDGCTTLETVSVTRDGNEFTGVITTTRPGDAVCTEALIDFERVIPLDVADLLAGDYAVKINEATTSFSLAVDNIAPTATPLDNVNGSIEGVVWHDLCGVGGGTPDEPLVVSDGCLASTADGYQANGVFDSREPFLSGVQVSLGEGACPQLPSISSTTDKDGVYSFSGLKGGTYCVFIDALSPQNRPVLIPGRWTAPESNIGYMELELEIGESVAEVNFGWDFDLLPPVNFEGCVNQVTFVEDVSIPDDTVFAPGEVFTKTWKVRNTGTCNWIPGYQLAYVAGDQMEGENRPIPLVLAGDEEDLSVVLRAPLAAGEYRGDWQLQNESGDFFGTGTGADLTFETLFLRILVEEPEIVGGAIRGQIWADVCDLLASLQPAVGCVSDEDGFSLGNGTLDEGESGLESIAVVLYGAGCPAEGEPVATVLTSDLGFFQFAELEAGEYCVAVDTGIAPNPANLGAGRWTFPALDISTVTVNLDEDEVRSGVDFGWDVEE